jgi:hypothetical protein
MMGIMTEPMAEVSATADGIHDGEAPGEAADEEVGEVDYPVRQAPRSQELPRHDEEGDREEREGVDALDRLLGHDDDGHLKVPEGRHGREDEDEGDGKTEDEEDDEGDAEDPDSCGVTWHRG